MPMKTYYKAVRHDYGSFHDPAFKYGPVGTMVEHPDFKPRGNEPSAAHYISVATVPTDCTSFKWRVNGRDSRLLVVEAVGSVFTPDEERYPNKRAVRALRVVGELPISAAFGPNGDQLVGFLEALSGLTAKQWDAARDAARDAAGVAAGVAAWVAARDAARDAAGAAAWDAAGVAARVAARDAARDAAGVAAWDAAGVAARALVVRDKITPEQFDTLTAPMRAAGVVFE